MSEIAIALDRISKCFMRYVRPFDRLRDLLLGERKYGDEFWALRDINLQIPKGESWGIVGRNGSGKSTLLQILVGTLTPTAGTVRTEGRISALLELGSGFNPEFTGRQNVFFNGRLLGLNREEIEAKFESIVAFADIGDFLDHPVRTYSSGMFVRLAFAVAISVEPDILVVDEALSVGDEVFQRKCFARIKQVKERGGTILFVSHSAAAVVDLCDRAVLLDRGELLCVGEPKTVVGKYHQLIYAPPERVEQLRAALGQAKTAPRIGDRLSSESNGSQPRSRRAESPLESYDPDLVPKSTINYVPRGAEIVDPEIATLAGKRANLLHRGGEYVYRYGVEFSQEAYEVRFGMLIKTISGIELGGAVSHPSGGAIAYLPPGEVVQVEFKFRCLLLPGVYFLNAGVVGAIEGTEVYLHRCIDAAAFRVQPERDLLATTVVDFEIEAKVTQKLIRNV